MATNWTLGFDANHFSDLPPGISSARHEAEMLERGHNNGRASIKRTYFTFEQMRKECEKLAAFLAGGKFEIDREADESTRAAQAFLRKGLFGNAGESMLAPFIGQEPKQ